MSDEKRIPTNLRMLLILEIMAEHGRPMTPTEINAQLGLPKASIHRLCETLLVEGFLQVDIDGRRLLPAPRTRSMSAGVLNVSRLSVARHQLLKKVATQLGETVNFVVPEPQGMTYRDRVETDWPLRIQLPVGSHVPFHCTASGKAFLASTPSDERDRLVSTLALERLATNTLTDVHELRAQLDDIERSGFAVDNEEFIDGMIAVAVPVRDGHGTFCAALAFHAPTQRMTMGQALQKRPVLEHGAQELSRLLFG